MCILESGFFAVCQASSWGRLCLGWCLKQIIKLRSPLSTRRCLPFSVLSALWCFFKRFTTDNIIFYKAINIKMPWMHPTIWEIEAVSPNTHNIPYLWNYSNPLNFSQLAFKFNLHWMKWNVETHTRLENTGLTHTPGRLGLSTAKKRVIVWGRS